MTFNPGLALISVEQQGPWSPTAIRPANMNKFCEYSRNVWKVRVVPILSKETSLKRRRTTRFVSGSKGRLILEMSVAQIRTTEFNTLSTSYKRSNC